MNFGTPEGIFGYSAVPDLTIEASPSKIVRMMPQDMFFSFSTKKNLL